MGSGTCGAGGGAHLPTCDLACKGLASRKAGRRATHLAGGLSVRLVEAGEVLFHVRDQLEQDERRKCGQDE